MQTAIACLFMRGSISRELLLPESDWPAEIVVGERVLFADAGVRCHQDPA